MDYNFEQFVSLPVIIAGGIRQTAKVPENQRINGGFAFYVDGGVDGAKISSSLIEFIIVSELPAHNTHHLLPLFLAHTIGGS